MIILLIQTQSLIINLYHKPDHFLSESNLSVIFFYHKTEPESDPLIYKCYFTLPFFINKGKKRCMSMQRETCRIYKI